MIHPAGKGIMIKQDKFTWSVEMKEPSWVSLELSRLESRGSTLSSSPVALQDSTLPFALYPKGCLLPMLFSLQYCRNSLYLECFGCAPLPLYIKSTPSVALFLQTVMTQRTILWNSSFNITKSCTGVQIVVILGRPS